MPCMPCCTTQCTAITCPIMGLGLPRECRSTGGEHPVRHSHALGGAVLVCFLMMRPSCFQAQSPNHSCCVQACAWEAPTKDGRLHGVPRPLEAYTRRPSAHGVHGESQADKVVHQARRTARHDQTSGHSGQRPEQSSPCGDDTNEPQLAEFTHASHARLTAYA